MLLPTIHKHRWCPLAPPYHSGEQSNKLVTVHAFRQQKKKSGVCSNGGNFTTTSTGCCKYATTWHVSSLKPQHLWTCDFHCPYPDRDVCSALRLLYLTASCILRICAPMKPWDTSPSSIIWISPLHGFDFVSKLTSVVPFGGSCSSLSIIDAHPHLCDFPFERDGDFFATVFPTWSLLHSFLRSFHADCSKYDRGRSGRVTCHLLFHLFPYHTCCNPLSCAFGTSRTFSCDTTSSLHLNLLSKPTAHAAFPAVTPSFLLQVDI